MKSRVRKKRIIGKKRGSLGDPLQMRKRLYEVLLRFYGFSQLEDFLFLNSDYFLSLCEVKGLEWSISASWPDKDFFKSPSKRSWPFQLSCPLSCPAGCYGELIFFSSQKFPESKKKLLKKITSFTASALYFIENKEKMEVIKREWGGAFDSFPQAFCITDKNFKIIRVNQSFQKISRTEKASLFAKNLFEVLPVSAQKLPQKDKGGSFLAQGEKNGQKLCLEISFKPLFLKKEKIQTYLFLIKDVSAEMEIEAKLSAQAKERELGLIKGSLAHELNNPISGVKALLDIVERQISQKAPSAKEDLKEMQKAMDTCCQIVSQLLRASQSPKSDFPLTASEKTAPPRSA